MNKKYFIIFLLPLIIGFISCDSMKHDEMSEHHKMAAVKMFEIFDSGNVDALDTLIAENVIDHQMDTSVTKKAGREGVKELFAHYHKIFPDMKSTIHSIAVSGDTVFVLATSEGTASEPFMGMPAGEKSSITGVDVLRMENDKIAEHWGFIDIMAMMQMMPSDNTKVKN